MTSDDDIWRKVEAILHQDFPLEELAGDPDLPGIIHAMRTRQQELERRNGELRRLNQALVVSHSHGQELPENWSQPEAALGESELLLRQIIEQMPYPVELCSPDGTATVVNQAFLDMFGIPSSAFVVGKYNVFEDPLVMEHLGLAEEIRRVYNGERIFISEVQIPLQFAQKNYQGQRSAPIVCEVTMFPVLKGSGETWQVVTIWQDITGRKRAEQQLQENNETLARRLEELAALNLIAQTVATVTDLSPVLQTVAALLAELLDGAGGIILLLDQTRAQLNIVAHASRRADMVELTGMAFPLPDAIRRQVIDRREALLIPDVQHNPRTSIVHDLLRRRNIHCLLNLPLLARDEVIGVIAVSSDQADRRFTPAEIRLAQTIAGQVAGAVEMARLFDEERRLRRMAESLREVSVALSSSLELKTVLDTIFAQIGQIIQCDGGGIFLREGDDLVLMAGVGPAAKAHLGGRVPLAGQNPTTRPFHQKRWCLIADGATERHWMKWLEVDIIYSWIGAPLLIASQCIGVLTVDSYTPRTFTAEEAEFLQIFANQAAVAIHNAQLHQQVQQDAETKATLLQEIHHRVKNNFQIVSSLLNFQATYVKDTQARDALQNSQRRVRTMAMIHEQLYRTPNLASIKFDTYVKQLTAGLVAAYQATLAHPIVLQHDISDIYLPLRIALPCGLIINELVSNALKHAFPAYWGATADVSGQVTVSFQSEDNDRYMLVVADNGIGLPAGFNPGGGESLGVFLVQAFAEQLDAALAWQSEPHSGTRFTITFKRPA